MRRKEAIETEAVRGWLYSILAVCVCAGAVNLLTPSGKSVKKSVSYITGLSLAAAILLPVSGVLGKIGGLEVGIPKSDVSEGTAQNLILGQAEENIELALEERARPYFGDVDVKVELDATDITSIKIEKISVFCDDADTARAARTYLCALMSCEKASEATRREK